MLEISLEEAREQVRQESHRRVMRLNQKATPEELSEKIRLADQAVDSYSLLDILQLVRELNSPKSSTQPSNRSRRKEVEGLLDSLDPEERLEVFQLYCAHCGDKDPTCQCWNED